VAKTSVDIDPQKLRLAQEALGTTTLRATIDAALQRVIDDMRHRSNLDRWEELVEEGAVDLDRILGPGDGDG